MWSMMWVRVKIHYLACCVLGHFSCVRLFATLWTAAHQAALSMGFSKQGYWSGLPVIPGERLFPTELPWYCWKPLDWVLCASVSIFTLLSRFFIPHVVLYILEPPLQSVVCASPPLCCPSPPLVTTSLFSVFVSLLLFLLHSLTLNRWPQPFLSEP